MVGRRRDRLLVTNRESEPPVTQLTGLLLKSQAQIIESSKRVDRRQPIHSYESHREFHTRVFKVVLVFRVHPRSEGTTK